MAGDVLQRALEINREAIRTHELSNNCLFMTREESSVPSWLQQPLAVLGADWAATGNVAGYAGRKRRGGDHCEVNTSQPPRQQLPSHIRYS